jgi:hypothetical protein
MPVRRQSKQGRLLINAFSGDQAGVHAKGDDFILSRVERDNALVPNLQQKPAFFR